VNYQTAMRELMDKPFCSSLKYREQQARSERKGAFYDKEAKNYPIVIFEAAFIRDLRRRGMPFFAHNMVRTAKQQDKLYKDGKSQRKGGKSAHNYGMAVDIIHSVHGWNIDKLSWEIVGHIGKEVAQRLGIEVRWGGDWNSNGVIVLDDDKERFWDPAHWELANWTELAGVK
jgi:hypothetical protein